MRTWLQKRWLLIFCLTLVPIYVQLNKGCNGNGFFCPTGFPLWTEIWSDVRGLQPDWNTVILINWSLGLFSLLLLLKLILPADWVLWAQHIAAVLIGSFLSWRNPWRPTFVGEPEAFDFEVAAAGFPFTYRPGITEGDSSPIFVANLIIALACMVGCIGVFEKLRGPWTPKPGTWNSIKKWFASVSLLFLYAQVNAYYDGFPFKFEAYDGYELEYQPWAIALNVLIGAALIVISIRHVPGKAWANVFVFVVFYVLANMERWYLLRDLLHIGGYGRGFPFAYDVVSENVDIVLLSANIVIGLLLTLLVYLLSSPPDVTSRIVRQFREL